MNTNTVNPHNIQAGQELYLVPNRSYHGTNRKVIVQKIGRKWAELMGGGRISLETLWLDGGQYSSSAKCYLSESEYKNSQVKQEYWEKLRACFPVNAPACTMDTLKQIASLMGLKP